MGALDYYLPVMAMLFVEFIYSGISLGSRTVFLQGMNPRVFIMYRHVFATIVIAPIAYFSGRKTGSYYLNLKSFSMIFLVTFFGITLTQNLNFEGIYLASASLSSAMANLVPAVTFIIAACLGMEKVNFGSLRFLAKVVGTVICVSGAVSMALLKGPKLLNAEKLPYNSILGSGNENWLLGCLSLVGCCIAWALWLILQVPASASHPDHLSFSAWMCLMATLQSAAVTLLLESDPNAWKIKSLLEFGCTLYAGVMGSAVLFFLQAWCISLKGPLFCAMFNPLLTVIVTILAAILLNEKIFLGSLIGAIGVIIGLYVVLWGKAEDVAMAEVKTDPQPMVNPTEEVKILMNESSQKEICETDFKEPLLSHRVDLVKSEN